MRITLTLILLCFFSAKQISAQYLTLGVTSGIGTFAMQDLKAMNETVSMPFSTRVVENYPAYFYYRPYVMLKFDKFGLGLNYSFQSTGSRVSGKDYSGEYRFDSKIHSNNAGILTDIPLLSGHRLWLSGSVQAGMQFSEISLTQYLQVLTNSPSSSTVTCTAYHFYGEPGLRMHYPLLPTVAIGVYAGYFIQMGKQPFKNKENKDESLVNPYTHDPIKPNWSGFRIGISVAYTFRYASPTVPTIP